MSTYETRKPTGLPSWPILLLAGGEKAGKTYSAAEASASDLVGRTFWIGVGEDDPDEYGAIEGARFEIVQHDGTYRSILGAIGWASAQEPVDGKPNLIVLDSAGRVWALLSDAAQATANERARRKNKTIGDDGAQITMDLWNVAKQRWAHILDALRDHQGPAIVTARLDHTSVVDGQGEPTKEKTWKVVAEKNLPFDVGACVHLRSFGDVWLTGVRSLRFRPKPNEYTRLDGFTVDGLWRNLGLGDAETTSERVHAAAVPQGEAAERQALLDQIAAASDAAGVTRQQVADDWAQTHNGQHIGEATDVGGLELVRDDLRALPARTQKDVA